MSIAEGCQLGGFDRKDTPFSKKDSPFSRKDSPFSKLIVCANYLLQENEFYLFTEAEEKIRL